MTRPIERKVYDYLMENGPTPKPKLVESLGFCEGWCPSYRQREEWGITTFQVELPKTGYGGRAEGIFYVFGEHSQEAIVEAWIEENAPEALKDEEEAKRIIDTFRREGRNCRRALRSVLDRYDVGKVGAGGLRGKLGERGGVCPLCDEEFSGFLPTHLQDCPER